MGAEGGEIRVAEDIEGAGPPPRFPRPGWLALTGTSHLKKRNYARLRLPQVRLRQAVLQ